MALTSKLVMLLILVAALVSSYRAESLEKEAISKWDEPAPPPPQPEAHTQWVALHITYSGPGSIRVMNAKLDWGKWYDYPNQDKEVSTVNGLEIQNRGPAGIVAASGREYVPSGTEGTFELHDDQGAKKKLVEIYFDCPWSGNNKLTKKTFSDNIVVEISDWTTSGPLGNIKVKIASIQSALQQEA